MMQIIVFVEERDREECNGKQGTGITGRSLLVDGSTPNPLKARARLCGCKVITYCTIGNPVFSV